MITTRGRRINQKIPNQWINIEESVTVRKVKTEMSILIYDCFLYQKAQTFAYTNLQKQIIHESRGLLTNSWWCGYETFFIHQHI